MPVYLHCTVFAPIYFLSDYPFKSYQRSWYKNRSDSTVSMTHLSLTLWQWHYGVWLRCVIDSTESVQFINNIKIYEKYLQKTFRSPWILNPIDKRKNSFTFFLWNCLFKLEKNLCIQIKLDITYSTPSITSYRLTLHCQKYRGAWPCSLIYIAEFAAHENISTKLRP